MSQTPAYYPLAGGLDLVTPAISIKPGRLITGRNYEPSDRGYRRCDGHERFDGKTRPSAATYWRLQFTNGDAPIVIGDVVSGDSSGASGIVMADVVPTTGSFDDGDAVGDIYMIAVSNEFEDLEDLTVSAVKVADANGEATERSAPTDDLDIFLYRAAIDLARADIGTVPGGGPVRGGFVYNGDTYAVRDDSYVAPTKAVLHKATVGGWVPVELGNTLGFDAGTVEFDEGGTITGGTSGATAVIHRVIRTSGDWGTTAAGRLVIGAVTGGPFQNNEVIAGSGGSATVNGVISANALPPGGRYVTRVYNFYGAANLTRVYGVNGVGPAFEFDGAVFAPILTGMVDDRPKWIACHKNQLFLGYPGGSIQHSGLVSPLIFTVITGADELTLGEEITGLCEKVAGDLLAIYGTGKIAVLYGNDSDDFSMVMLTGKSGALPWTVEMADAPLHMDFGGVRALNASEQFGNFNMGTVTRYVKKLMDRKKARKIKPIAAMVIKDKDQYRLFWEDGTGLHIFLGKQSPEITELEYPFAPTSTWSGEDDEGFTRYYVGRDDGYVIELDAGTSFDGEVVPAMLRLPFNHVGSPSRDKNFKGCELEIDAAPNAVIGVVAEFDYGDPDQPPSQEQSFAVRGGGGFWNEATWNAAYWSSPVEGLAAADIPGMGRNVSIAILSNAIYEAPHSIHGLTLHFTYRRLRRGS